MAFFFGIVAAMAVFSYLYSARSVGMMHALPLRREGLFLTSYLSGLSFFVLPNAAIFLITLAAEAVVGVVNPAALGVWFLTQLLCTLFFYSFAVFCAMFTGHILALPAFYVILNFLASVLAFIVQGLLSALLYGFVSSPVLTRIAAWLTPTLKLADQLYARANMDWEAMADPIAAGSYSLSGLGYALIFAAVGIVLAGLALLAYRRRHLETAGDIVAMSWVRPVFKYGFAACAAMVFGSLLYSIFSYALPSGAWTLLIFMALCGVIGYFVAEMLLQKSFRVFHRWKGCVVFLICLAAVTAALELDLTGFETRVPDPASVTGAQVSRLDSAPYDTADYSTLAVDDPEALALLTRIHQCFVDLGEGDAEDRAALYDSDAGWKPAALRVDYTLKNGATLSRSYDSALVCEADLSDPDSLASLLTAFLNRPEHIRKAYRLDEVDAGRLVDISVDLYDAQGNVTQPSVQGEANRQRLWNAVLADFETGALGRRYLFDYSEDRLENTCVNDLTVTFLSPEDKRGTSYTDNISISLTPAASNTIAVLEDLGLLTEEDLFTHADWDAPEEYEVYAEPTQAELVALPAER